jgi:hypothetical protein
VVDTLRRPEIYYILYFGIYALEQLHRPTTALSYRAGQNSVSHLAVSTCSGAGRVCKMVGILGTGVQHSLSAQPMISQPRFKMVETPLSQPQGVVILSASL